MTVAQVRRIPVAPGVALHALVWPAPAGRVPVLLVHGLASNARTWDQVAARLAALGHPVGAVDQRGHGGSDKPDVGYDFATLGADLVGVLDFLDWDQAVIVGQSTGGNIALDLAIGYPDRVAGLVGVDGGLIELVDRWPRWEDCASELAPPLLVGTPASDLEEWLRARHPDWSEAAIGSTMANFEIRPDQTLAPWLTLERHLRILRSLWEHRPSALLAGLSVPAVFVLADTGDAWAASKRVEADRAQVLNPVIGVEWFSPADHDVHVAQADAVADLIHNFATRAGAEPPTAALTMDLDDGFDLGGMW